MLASLLGLNKRRMNLFLPHSTTITSATSRPLGIFSTRSIMVWRSGAGFGTDWGKR
jgi:hypothetical protein